MSETPHDPLEPGRSAHPSSYRPGPEVFGRCTQHWFEAAIARCDDCSSQLCVDCLVAADEGATFCAECALARAGIRARRPYRRSRKPTTPYEG